MNMDINTFIECGKVAVMIICGGLACYFKYSEKAQKKAKEVQEVLANVAAKAVVFIKEAEEDYKDTTNAGGKKFEQVVNKLYDLVPKALQPIITKEMIGDVVQSTFDQIEEYVKLQLDNAIESIDG